MTGRPLLDAIPPWLRPAFWGPWIPVAAVTALCALVVVQMQASPFGLSAVADEAAYVLWAQRILGGKWLSDAVFFFDPLYAYVLAGLWWVSDESVLFARLFNVACAAVTARLVWLTAERAAGRWEAVVASGLLALLGPFYFHHVALLKEPLVYVAASALAYLFVLLQEKGTLGRWIALGLTTGFFVVMRGHVVIVLPLLVLWAWEKLSHERPARCLGWTAAACLAFALPLVPPAVHNLLVAGWPSPTTTTAGFNFFLGNNPRSDGANDGFPSGVRPGPLWIEHDSRDEASRRVGRELTPQEASEFWMAQGMRWVREEPAAAARLWALKIWYLVHAYDNPDDYDLDGLRRFFVPALRVPFLDLGWIMGAALLGALLLWRERPRLQPLIIGALAYGATLVPFHVLGRYRGPITIVAVILAAAFAVRAARWLAERRYGRIGVSAAALAALTVGLYWPNPVSVHAVSASAQVAMDAAQVLREKGRFEEALAVTRRAAEVWPGYAPALAAALASAGKTEEAIAAYEELLARSPDDLNALRSVAGLLVKTRRYADARRHLEAAGRLGFEDAAAWESLGAALAQASAWQDARSALERALRASPGLAQANAWMARVEVAEGQCDRALQRLPNFADRGDSWASGARRLLEARCAAR